MGLGRAGHDLTIMYCIPRASQVAQWLKKKKKKKSAANAGDTRDMDVIPGSRRSPGVGNCNPL